MSLFGRGRSSDKKPAPPPPPAPPPTALQPPLRQPSGFETVLGPETVIEGLLRSDANIRLDGKFTGTLEISGNVLVGDTANITADIDAHNISIAGTVRGNISGNRVQILRTAHVWGDIQATALTTEEGAFIDGSIKMNTSGATQSHQLESSEKSVDSTIDKDEAVVTVTDDDTDAAQDEENTDQTLVFDKPEETLDENDTLMFRSSLQSSKEDDIHEADTISSLDSETDYEEDD